jgi:hypothetical protein
MDNDALAADEGCRLLLDILPVFTSNTNQIASDKDPCSQAYYYMIGSEAQRLEDSLKDCNTRVPQYADVLAKILKLFESIIQPDVLLQCNSFLV